MNRLSSWFAAKVDDDPQADLDAEVANLAHAMQATRLLLNDDIDAAHEQFQTRDSSFHDNGEALIFFMRAVLGFERENMTKTSELLAKCEARAWTDLKRAQRRSVSLPGQVYPPGTEYELLVAQTQIMSAVVGILHESIIEGMKSFLKLRRAYISLDGILQKEKTYMRRASASTGASTLGKGNGSDADSADAKDVFSGAQTPASSKTSLEGSADAKVEDELTNPIDAFVHSGVSMCMGMLQLILSLVPPAFGRILSVVGFRGDREAGVRMLWRSVTYPNVYGAVAGIMLLSYYHSMLELVDIQPHRADFDESAEPYGTPVAKCAHLLTTMRERFPESRLWLIEEAKTYAVDKDLRTAIHTLDSGPPSKMKQVTAINDFSLAIFAMSAQDWPQMRRFYLRCLEVNDWSSGLYYYMVGAASLELYRDALERDDATEAKVEKEKAEKYFRKTSEVTNKKKFMSRQLPIEAFVQRKLQKWEARAKALELDLADVVSVSPALEVVYMWNGQRYMAEAEYKAAERHLSWDRLTAPADKVDKLKDTDEMGVWAVAMSSILRGSKRLEEARANLEKYVLSQDKMAFKGEYREDYVMPAAIYEIAAISWAECGQPPADLDEEEKTAYERKKAAECEENLEKARNWEGYVLDARMGMRIQSGLATLGWYHKKKNWA